MFSIQIWFKPVWKKSNTCLNTNVNVGVVSLSIAVDDGVNRFHPIIPFANWNGGADGFWLWIVTVTVSPSASLADTRYMLDDKGLFSKHEVCWSLVEGFENTGEAFCTEKNYCMYVMYTIRLKMDWQTENVYIKTNRRSGRRLLVRGKPMMPGKSCRQEGMHAGRETGGRT